jgi:hypothetical protein
MAESPGRYCSQSIRPRIVPSAVRAWEVNASLTAARRALKVQLPPRWSSHAPNPLHDTCLHHAVRATRRCGGRAHDRPFPPRISASSPPSRTCRSRAVSSTRQSRSAAALSSARRMSTSTTTEREVRGRTFVVKGQSISSAYLCAGEDYCMAGALYAR